MYFTLYDINFNSLTQPITNAQVKITDKAFDFATINISGYTKEQIDDAVIFRLDEEDGTEVYSGFVYKITPKDNTLEIQGKDLREFFASELSFDFVAMNAPKTLNELFNFLANQFRNTKDPVISAIDFEIVVPDDDINFVDLFGDLSGQVITVDAYKFLLPYLKYYGYVLRSHIDWSNNRLVFSFDKERAFHEIRLPDFIHDLQQTQPLINKTVAIQRHAEFGYQWKKQTRGMVWRDLGKREWIDVEEYPPSNYIATKNYRNEFEWQWWKNLVHNESAYFSSTPSCRPGFDLAGGVGGQWICTPRDFYWVPNNDGGAFSGKFWDRLDKDESNSVYEIFGYRVARAIPHAERVVREYIVLEEVEEWVDVEPLETVYALEQPVEEDPSFQWVQTGEILKPDGAIRYYFLDKNNTIHHTEDESLEIPNRYYPVKSKVFTAEYLANAQFEAILELCNQRYVDNIYIDTEAPYNPIDLTTAKINDMVEVYQDGFYKELPISEKTLRVDAKGIKRQIKLGFKREKLVDIVNHDLNKDRETIKSQSEGGGELNESRITNALGYTPADADDIDAIESDVSSLQDEVGTKVPTSRKINNKSLTDDIQLTAEDVGARDDEWTPTFAQVRNKPTNTVRQVSFDSSTGVMVIEVVE